MQLKRWAGLLLVVAAGARAQGGDFTLPSFAPPDAGVIAPSSPPPPPPAVQPEASPDESSPLPPDPPPAAPRAPPPIRWNRIGGTLSGLFLALQNVYLGGEFSFLAGFGSPTLSLTDPTQAEGWLMQLGLQLSYGKVTGPLCQGSSFCATRYAGGLAVKGGWGRGTPDREGWTKPGLMFYGQVDLLLGFLDIPPAPLAPSVSSWEGIGRLRAGLHYASLGKTASVNKVTLNAALVFEVIPLSNTAKGVSLGLALGVAL